MMTRRQLANVLELMVMSVLVSNHRVTQRGNHQCHLKKRGKRWWLRPTEKVRVKELMTITYAKQ